MKNDSYYCDKYHREKNEPPTEWGLENEQLQRQWYAAENPWKYGVQLQFNF